ncbi:MAG: hypothetical protein ACRC2T_08465, partial [Thermoguttaceae bacterium]
TWVTFPVWIGLFCWLTLFLGKTNREHPLAVNAVDLIDIAPAEGIGRVTTWAGVFSPKDQRYDISLSNNLGSWGKSTQESSDYSSNVQTDFDWLGLAGSGLGGMEPKTIPLSLWDDSYYHMSQIPNTLSGVPIGTRSTKSFYGQTVYFAGNDKNGPETNDTPDVDDADDSHNNELTDSKGKESAFSMYFKDTQFKISEGIPTGKLTNEFPVAIENPFVLYRNWALKPCDRLEPGETVELNAHTVRRELRLLLNSTPMGFDESKQMLLGRELMSYSVRAGDEWPILRTITLYNALGGYEAIGLSNTFTNNLDWSENLQLNRAILIGELDTSKIIGTEVGNMFRVRPSGEPNTEYPKPNQKTILRVLLPVTTK